MGNHCPPSRPQLTPLAPLCPWLGRHRPRGWGQGQGEACCETWLLNHGPDVTGTPLLQGQMPGDPELLTKECHWQDSRVAVSCRQVRVFGGCAISSLRPSWNKKWNPFCRTGACEQVGERDGQIGGEGELAAGVPPTSGPLLPVRKGSRHGRPLRRSSRSGRIFLPRSACSRKESAAVA